MVIREMQRTIMTVLVGLGFAFLLHTEEALAAPLADKHFVPRYTDSFRTDAQFDPALAWLSAQASRDVYSYSFEDLRLHHLLNPSDFQISLNENGFRDIQFVSYANPNTWDSPLGNDLAWSDWMDKFLHPATAVDKASALGQFAEASLQVVVASRSIVVDGRKKNVVAIVFRGTEGTSKDGIPDWIVNAAGNQVPFSATDPLVLVHEGFLTAMQKFVAKSGTVNIGASNLTGLVQAHSADTIFWISGHSLGGAIATLYGAWLEDQGVSRDNIVIYTFGAPLVGNDHFRYVYFQECLLSNCDATARDFLLTKKLNLHRARNLIDPVPYAPYLKALVSDMMSSLGALPKSDRPSVIEFGKSYIKASSIALEAAANAGYDLLVRTGDWPYQPIGYQHILEWNASGQLLDYTDNPATNFIDRWKTITFSKGIDPHDMQLYVKNMEELKLRSPSNDVQPKIVFSPQPNDNSSTYLDVFAGSVDVTLTTDPGVTLYYTLDGTAPKVNDYPVGSGLSNASSIYTSPIRLVYTGWGPSQQISMRVMAVAADGSTVNTHERIYRLSAKNLDVSTQSYLQIIAPDRQVLALDGSDHSFYAAAGQVLELKLMNWSNAPLGFASLGGKPKIFVLQTGGVICPGGANYNGKTVRCELAVSAPATDGTVQLTFPSAGYYQLLAVAYATGSGESLLVYPIVATETVSLATGGTVGTGTGTTATALHPLNDTGITGFADTQNNLTTEPSTHPGQDARFGRDAQAGTGKLVKIGGGGKGFDYSKIANNGSVLPESAVLGSGPTDWACTRDNVTGLLWEVKTASGLRSQSHTYTWYNSNAATNGGFVGTASGGTCFATGRCDTEKFVADVNVGGLCGHSDWRMPSYHELQSIVDYGRVSPAIDPTGFPNTPASGFWSASAYANNSGGAWNIDFSYGSYGDGTTIIANRVRLVRAPLPAGYVAQGGLTWMPVTFKNNPFAGNAWNATNAYCTGTTINGQTGWRMPTQAELIALYTSGAMNGQGWNLDTWGVWSSTPAGAGSHISVSLYLGNASSMYDSTTSVYVSCVREP